MKGYKATDKDMKCRDFQFELGKWYEHDGDLITCSSGFHFCEQPSGPWAYYSEPTTRIFEIEADDVLETPFEPGADFKRVARRIRLVKEITPPKESYRNTGDGNTGHRNTGYGNTGDGNTGYGNGTNFSSGFFCTKEPRIISFDVQTKLTREQFTTKYPEYWALCEKLLVNTPIEFEQFKKIPGITKKKLKVLHDKFIAARAK